MRQQLHSLNRKILVIDVFVLSISYALALLLRFHVIHPWQRELYASVYIAEVVLYACIHIYRSSKKEYEAVLLQDPIVNTFVILQNMILMYGLVLVYLVITQAAQKVSRMMLGIDFVLCIFLSVFARLVYRQHEKLSNKRLEQKRRVLILTDAGNEARVRRFFEEGAGDRAIGSLYVLEDKKSAAALREDLSKDKEAGACEEAFLYLPKADDAMRGEMIRVMEQIGLDTAVALTLDHTDLTDQMIHTVNGYKAAFFLSLHTRCNILGVDYCVSSIKAAVVYCKNHLEDLKGQYICFSNVHTTVMAYEDPQYRKIQNSSAFTFADGAPIAKVQGRRGNLGAYRVSGPDFMDAMFRESAGTDIKHYFYGSSEETIALLSEKLPKRYPGLQIVGLESPPFRELTKEEDEAAMQRIKDSGADIIWIGLGAPKQEKWMYAHKDRLPGVMCGVGAGFNFYAGNIRRAPYWMQRAGLEWLYRLFQDPKRLFKRYLVTNLKFVWYLLTTGEIGKRG